MSSATASSSAASATSAAARPAVRSRWAGVGSDPQPASGAAPGLSSPRSAPDQLVPASGGSAASSGRGLPTNASGGLSVVRRAWARPAPSAAAVAASGGPQPSAASSAEASTATGAAGESLSLTGDVTGSSRDVPGNQSGPHEGAVTGAVRWEGQRLNRDHWAARGWSPVAPTGPIRRLPLGLGVEHRGLARAIDSLPGPGTKDPAPHRVIKRWANLRRTPAAPQAIPARGAAHLPVAPGIAPAVSGVAGAVSAVGSAVPGTSTAIAATAATTATGQAAAVRRQVGEATPAPPLRIPPRTPDVQARDGRHSASIATTPGQVPAAPPSTPRPTTPGGPERRHIDEPPRPRRTVQQWCRGAVSTAQHPQRREA